MKLHTTVLNGGTRRARVLNFLAWALLACFAADSSTKAATAPLVSSNRFLFIIDASASMKPFDKGLRETVFDLIYSGMRGRMTNGDTYGVWVVQDKNDTSFAMDTWKEHHAVEMAAKATAHVKDRGFKGKARVDLALTDALRVVRNVGDLTIVLVSNGETPVSGTPFDDAINGRFRELAPQMKRAKATLNTVLVAQDKALIAWAANGPEFLIEVPRVAPKPKPTKPDIARGMTNGAVVANGLAAAATAQMSTNPALQKPRTVANPIIITKDTVAKEKRAWAAMTSTATNTATNDSGVVGATNEIAAAALRTNAAASSSNTLAILQAAIDTQPIATNLATNLSAASTAAATFTSPMPKRNTEPTNQISAEAPLANVKTTEQVVAAQPAAAAIAPVNGTRSEQSRPGFQPLVWIIAGAALAVICVLVGVVVARGQRREPSLISQAVAQQRVH